MLDSQPRLIVGIADIKVGQAPASIRTSVGSCIALCLYHDKKKVGGMLHLMLPYMSTGLAKEFIKKAKFADTGIPEMLDMLEKMHGVAPGELTAKFFGGAKALKMVTQDIGKENEKAVREILREYRIPIRAAKTGGEKGYQVDFDLSNGKVSVRVIGEPAEEF